MSDVKLYLGDCLEILPTLAAGSVDAVVTDPPYGIGIANNPFRGKFIASDWDNKPASDMHIKFILSYNVPTVIWGGNYFGLPSNKGFFIGDGGIRLDKYKQARQIV